MIAQELYELRTHLRAADAFGVQLTSDGKRLAFGTVTFNIGEGAVEIIGGETGSGN